MLDVKTLLTKILQSLKSWQTILTPAFICKEFTKTVSVPATGWSGYQTFSFTVPSGYTALPGVAFGNSGYITLYDNAWAKGSTQASFSAYNRYSGSISLKVTARVIFVRNELI